jgi:AcrR family transcriptional regulator
VSSEPSVPSPKVAGEAPAVPPEVLRLARRRLVSGARLEMSALAAELGVNRVTLYRWVGSRERLLVEVLWSMADRALRAVRSQVPAAPDRAVKVVVGFLECVLANPGMQHLLAADPELTMRLLTHRAAGFQPRLLAAVEELLREETAAGRLDVPMDAHELAYVVVRVIESYTYLDVLLGEEPEAHRAEAALHVLLDRRTR